MRSCCGARSPASPPDAAAPDARRHLEAIAGRSRPAGGDAEDAARAYCASELRALGFTVGEEPFEYSRFPGEWATPLGGVAACLTIAVLGALGASGRARAALIVLAVVMAVGLPIATRVAERGVSGLQFMRARATNLVATRGQPGIWLVAHLDSKSQPVPMLARVFGIVASALVLLALFGMSVAGMLGFAASRDAWILVTLVGVVSSLPVAASTVGTRSPGAIDDASGVATVLRAAAMLPAEMHVGVVLTSAEELGMAGARAFASRHPVGIALNVDGVDDHGRTLCMTHGGTSRAREAVSAGARTLGERVNFGLTIPGLLTDGVALANAGWSAVTLSRGSIATLARIHRASDNLQALRGDGIEEMARLVTAAATELH